MKLRQCSNKFMDSKQQTNKILLLPWLAHGHLSPFLELAKKLSSKNFHVYICSTPVNLHPFIQNQDIKHLNSIEFIELNLPAFPELPPEYHTTKNLPPSLMPLLKTAFDGAKERFRDIINTLKPELIIYDFLQPWAPQVAEDVRIPAVLFLSLSAATSAFLIHFAENPDLEYPFPEFGFPKSESENMVHFLYNVSNGISDKDRTLQCVARSSRFVLIKTSNDIEKKYVSYLSTLARKEVIPVGPLIQEPEKNSGDSQIIEWLNKKDPCSVVFVSFGSEYFLSEEEIAVVAQGLELTKISFIWVVRFHGRQNVRLHQVLPDKFQENVAERGMVLEGWAPQAKILSHPSLGGFVSHCGWSSTLESIACGVPIIAMPMQLDQPLNARLVVDVEVGTEVKRENGKYRKEKIAKVIREVVLEEQGKDVRKKVRELSEKIKEKGDQEMDNVVHKLLQLVKETKY